MKFGLFKAPEKTSILKKGLFAAFTFICATSAFNLEAQAQEIENTKEEVKTEILAPKYVETTFGETINASVCVAESDMEKLTRKVCEEEGFEYVSPELLESVAYQESRFVPTAENGTAISMFQIKPEYHELSMIEAGVTLDEFKTSPEAQIRVAGYVLENNARMCLDRGLEGEEIQKGALAYYHLTLKSANEMIESRNFDKYVESVMNRADLIEANRVQYRDASTLFALDNGIANEQIEFEFS